MKNENVVQFSGITKLDLPAEHVLRQALEAGLTDVVIVGYTEDGEEYFASSVADGGSTLWMIERCKMALLSIPDEMAD
jgi:hypothetical protein